MLWLDDFGRPEVQEKLRWLWQSPERFKPGRGNFLYLALECLKDIEHQVNLEAEALGLERQHDVTGPHNVLGIEINECAAELARVTVWIGELQWRIQRGYGFKLNPVLEPLDHIECRDVSSLRSACRWTSNASSNISWRTKCRTSKRASATSSTLVPFSSAIH